MLKICLKAPKNRNKYVGGFSLLLCAVFFYGSLSTVKSQGNIDFQKPFAKCRTLFEGSGTNRIIASDNDKKNFLLLKENKIFSLIDSSDLTEIWRTEIKGVLESGFLFNHINGIYITSSTTQSGNMNFSLNSLSLKTGVTNWQKDLTGENLRLISDGRLLFISSSEGIYALYEIDGSLAWKFSIKEPALEIGKITKDFVSVIFEKKILQIEKTTGKVLKTYNLENGKNNALLILEDSVILGTDSGEVIKFYFSRDNPKWKFKTGGTISSLTQVEKGILAASFDNFVYLFNTKNGKLKWKKRNTERINLDPLISGNNVLISSVGGSKVSVIALNDGRFLNQIQLEEGNSLLGEPYLLEDFLLLQTTRGIYVFSNNGCQ